MGEIAKGVGGVEKWLGFLFKIFFLNFLWKKKQKKKRVWTKCEIPFLLALKASAAFPGVSTAGTVLYFFTSPPGARRRQ